MKFNLKSPREIGGEFTEKMYLGKRKILRADVYEERRRELMKTKEGAAWLAFTELEDLLDTSAVAQQYFNKPGEWMAQRIQGCTLRRKDEAFSAEEYDELTAAFRDIAKRLQAHADEIDAAKMD